MVRCGDVPILGLRGQLGFSRDQISEPGSLPWMLRWEGVDLVLAVALREQEALWHRGEPSVGRAGSGAGWGSSFLVLSRERCWSGNVPAPPHLDCPPQSRRVGLTVVSEARGSLLPCDLGETPNLLSLHFLVW